MDSQLLELIKKSETNLTLLISSNEDLNKGRILYILEVESNSNAAGGRSAGFGSRKFSRIYGFDLREGRKLIESNDLDGIEANCVIRLPLTLDDGSEIMVSCAIDAEIVDALNARFNIYEKIK